MQINRPTLIAVLRNWWCEQRRTRSLVQTALRLAAVGVEFLRDSLPDRRRQKFGDIDYDWEHRVNTTSANVSWRARLIGLLTSSYQPIEPFIFHEIMQALALDCRGFTFIDIGSGKGRALLMAWEYPFERVLGIELLPELNKIAEENIQRFASPNRKSASVETLCLDAADFDFPAEPLVVFLFHPLTQAAFERVIENLARSLRERLRPVRVIYANPVFERVLLACGQLQKVTGTRLYSVFREASIKETGS